MGMLPKSNELSESLLGGTELEAQRTLGMIIDLLIMVEEDRDLDDPDNNPDSVALYQELFGDGD